MSKHFDTNNKSREELSGSLTELRIKLSQLGFDQADKKLKDVSQFKKTKKDIARILTRLHAYSAEAASAAKAGQGFGGQATPTK